WLLGGNSGTDGSQFLGTTDNQPLVFRTNNTERMRLLANGNLGIGVDNPGFRLEGNAPSQLGGQITGPSSGVGAARSRVASDAWELLGTGANAAQGSNRLNIRNSNSGVDIFTLKSNGFLGLGTTDPQFRLDVNGTIRGNNVYPSDARYKTHVQTFNHALDA